jgi:hypothetical protein
VTDADVKFPVPSASVLQALGYRAGRAAMAVGESETSTSLRPLAELWRHGR